MWNKQCPLDLLVDDGSIEVCIILFISHIFFWVTEWNERAQDFRNFHQSPGFADVFFHVFLIFPRGFHLTGKSHEISPFKTFLWSPGREQGLRTAFLWRTRAAWKTCVRRWIILPRPPGCRRSSTAPSWMPWWHGSWRRWRSTASTTTLRTSQIHRRLVFFFGPGVVQIWKNNSKPF